MRQEVNFLPLVRRRRQPLEADQIAALLGVLVVVLGLWSGWDRWQLHRMQEALDGLQARQATLTEEVQSISSELSTSREAEGEDPAVSNLRSELDRRRMTLAALDRSSPENAGFVRELEGLARQTLSGVWLERIEITARGERIHLLGNARHPEQIPEFIAALRSEEVFSGQRFRRLALTRTDAGWMRFDLATVPRDEASADTRTGAADDDDGDGEPPARANAAGNGSDGAGEGPAIDIGAELSRLRDMSAAQSENGTPSNDDDQAPADALRSIIESAQHPEPPRQ